MINFRKIQENSCQFLQDLISTEKFNSWFCFQWTVRYWHYMGICLLKYFSIFYCLISRNMVKKQHSNYWINELTSKFLQKIIGWCKLKAILFDIYMRLGISIGKFSTIHQYIQRSTQYFLWILCISMRNVWLYMCIGVGLRRLFHLWCTFFEFLSKNNYFLDKPSIVYE